MLYVMVRVPWQMWRVLREERHSAMSALPELAGRRILFLNWRDLMNPISGGAEVHTEQIARRFAQAGALLTLFTSKYDGAAPYDWSNDYLVVRQGGRLGVYLAAARHLRKFGHQYDAIVDCQNGIPFFAPAFAPRATPVICMVHHVHQEQFDMYFRWPANHLGRLLEGKVTRRVYRNGTFVAVSPSTRAEMRRQLRLRMPVHIVPSAFNPLPHSTARRSSTPTIAVVTRLVPHKQLHHLVEAVPELLQRWPELHVDIAGTGSARDGLLARVKELGLERSVNLPGMVTEQVKSDLLSRAWLTVAPSLAEGWGLTVLEANTLGTPTLAYNVPGLQDSVRHRVTGWLVSPGDGLGRALGSALEELSDPCRQQVIADACRQWSSRFSWDLTAERMARVLLSEISRAEHGAGSQRQVVDLATVALWAPGDADKAERYLRKELRVTDEIARSEAGLRVLLRGCDDLAAARALQRVPVPPTKIQLATTTDVLCGAAGDCPG
jgi:glycosyltransferase involved in cell wall biosynthesis